MELNIIANLRTEDLVESLSQDNAEKLIKEIDSAMEDYSFTERMAKHFIAELVKECEAGAGAFDINELLPKKDQDLEFNVGCPPQLREFVSQFCTLGDIRGKADPMYIANLVAMEMSCSLGKGRFAKLPQITPAQAERIAERLQDIYSSNIAPDLTARVIGMLQHTIVPDSATVKKTDNIRKRRP